jgi:hypothetical protein
MRVLILSLILLVPLTSSSFAMSTGDLYQYCKPFADRAFEGKTSDDLACVTYFRGVADSGFKTCATIKEVITKPELSAEQKAVFNVVMTTEGLAFADGSKLKPAIQLFVNEMAASPEKWDSGAIWRVYNSLQKVAPCE